MIVSPQAEELIAKAKEAFSLQMISESQLNNIVRRASTEPDYNGVCDIPFDWDIDNARAAWHRAERKARRGRMIRLLRRFV